MSIGRHKAMDADIRNSIIQKHLHEIDKSLRILKSIFDAKSEPAQPKPNHANARNFRKSLENHADAKSFSRDLKNHVNAKSFSRTLEEMDLDTTQKINF